MSRYLCEHCDGGMNINTICQDCEAALRAENARLTTEAESREAECSAGLVAAAETVRDLQVSHSQVVEMYQTELAALVAECDAAKADRDAMAVTMGDLLMKTVARRDFDEMRDALATEKAAHAATRETGKRFEREARAFYDQSCANLQRAEAAESQRDALRVALEELRDIVQGHIDDGDRLDSLTLQPARTALAAVPAPDAAPAEAALMAVAERVPETWFAYEAALMAAAERVLAKVSEYDGGHRIAVCLRDDLAAIVKGKKP